MRPELDEGGWVVSQVNDQSRDRQHVLCKRTPEQYPVFVKWFDEAYSHPVIPFIFSMIPPKSKPPNLKRA